MNDINIKCPECKSTSYSKAGYSVRDRQKVQRYRCNKCLRVFTPEDENKAEAK